MAWGVASASVSASVSPWDMASLRKALPHSRVSASLSVRPRRALAPARRRLEVAPKLTLAPSFPALASCILPFDSVCANVENALRGVRKGFRVLMMRHGRRVPKLNRPPDQRKALLRGLTTQLLKHGRIKTTQPRAKAMRKYVDKMITLAKVGTLHKRRQALGFIYEKQTVHALFAEVQERYGDRNGGYTRIIRTLPRRGDNAPMAYIELV